MPFVSSTNSFCCIFVLILLTACKIPSAQSTEVVVGHCIEETAAISPKVFIISMFTPEAQIWHGVEDFDLLAHNVTVPGLSPLFPDVYCTEGHDTCQLVTGEGETNAAVTLTSLLFSPVFDLRETYFLIAGIAGVNPRTATVSSVTLARYEIQCALQYEFDNRDLPANFSTGYIPQGAFIPSQYPQIVYGTEVFELNANLRDRAIQIIRAANVTLNDTSDSIEYRARYAVHPDAQTMGATKAPSVIACDGVTSDTYFAGTHLTEAFDNYTTLVTNGTGVFCASGQEDSATLEALLRSSAANKTDFSRIIAMRTASDFTAPAPGESSYLNLKGTPSGTFDAAVSNIKIAGMPIIRGILRDWNTTFKEGIKAQNYIGDILGTLGGTPDFGPPSEVLSNTNPTRRDIRNDVTITERQKSGKQARRALLPELKLV